MVLVSLIAMAQEKLTLKVDNFTGISFGVQGELILTQGAGFSVTLEGDRDLLNNIETYVTNGRLVIKKDSWRDNMNKKVTVWVTMPDITSLSVSGSGNLRASGSVKCDELHLSVSGSGKINLENLVAKELESGISGSGSISVSGRGAEICDISISGSGHFSAEEFEVGEMEISVSGSGSCRVNVVKSLEASISGSGNIYYRGDPRIDSRSSGSGRIRSF